VKIIKTNTNKQLILCIITLVLLLLLRLVDTSDFFISKEEAHNFVYLQDSFNYRYFDTIQELDKLNKNTNFYTGEHIYIEGYLPQKEYKLPALQLFSLHSKFRLYINGNLLYEYGYNKNNKIIGSGFHTIMLNHVSSSDKITFDFEVTEAEAPLEVKSLAFGEYDLLTFLNLKRNTIGFTLTLFTLILGFVLIYLSFVFLKQKLLFKILFLIGLCSISISFWILGNTKLLQYFTSNLSLITNIEYQSFYLGFICFCYVIKKIFNNRFYKTNSILVFLDFLFVSIFELLHIFDIFHYPQTLYFFHLTIAVNLIIYFCELLSVFFSTQKNTVNQPILFGLLGFILIIGIELVEYKYRQGNFEKTFNITFFIYGYLYLLANVFIAIIQLVSTSKEEKDTNIKLQKMAFKDQLTQLANRSICEGVVSKLSQYTLILFDLNNLKLLNDAFGHKVGDIALVEFANLLTKVFTADSTICRIGGDEFLVINKSIDNEYIDNYIRNYDFEMRQLVKKSEKNISASFGIAKTSEVENFTFETVFNLADKRMYENKKEFYAKFSFKLSESDK